MYSLSHLYLFSDIDGTLGIAGQGIPQRNREAIARFVAKGGHFALCTGRGISNIKPFVEGLPINSLSIIGNGCAIYDFAADQTVSTHYLPDQAEEYLHRVLERWPEAQLLLINEEGYFVSSPDGRPVSAFCGEFPQHPLQEIPGPYYKFLFAVPEEEAQQMVEELWSWQLPDVTFVRSSSTFIEMLPAGVNKGSCFQKLCRDWNIPVENTVFIGDFYNDREMFQAAGLSACVDTTPDDLKPLCQMVLGSCMDGAVADLIELLEARCENVALGSAACGE